VITNVLPPFFMVHSVYNAYCVMSFVCIDRHWLPIEQRIVFKLFTDAPSSYRTSSILSAKLRHGISRRDLTSSSTLHQQSTIWTVAYASEVWRTFIFLCWTTARTDRHWHFQTSTKTFLFQQVYQY